MDSRGVVWAVDLAPGWSGTLGPFAEDTVGGAAGQDFVLTVTLTATDNDGLTATATTSLTLRNCR